jgi:hypothetical protein
MWKMKQKMKSGSTEIVENLMIQIIPFFDRNVTSYLIFRKGSRNSAFSSFRFVALTSPTYSQ